MKIVLRCWLVLALSAFVHAASPIISYPTTVNTVPKWITTNAIGNSAITDDGATASILLRKGSFTQTAIGTNGPVDAKALWLDNTTLATSLIDQSSPALVFKGASWHSAVTTGSQPVLWRIYNSPYRKSASVLGSNLKFQTRINGATDSAWTDTFTLGTDNVLSVGGGRFIVDDVGDITAINNVSYSFPASQGNPGDVLQNDGTGFLTWGAAGGAVSLNNITADNGNGTIDNTSFTNLWRFTNNVAAQQSFTMEFGLGNASSRGLVIRDGPNPSTGGGSANQYILTVSNMVGSTAQPLRVAQGATNVFDTYTSAGLAQTRFFKGYDDRAGPSGFLYPSITFTDDNTSGIGMNIDEAQGVTFIVGGTPKAYVDSQGIKINAIGNATQPSLSRFGDSQSGVYFGPTGFSAVRLGGHGIGYFGAGEMQYQKMTASDLTHWTFTPTTGEFSQLFDKSGNVVATTGDSSLGASGQNAGFGYRELITAIPSTIPTLIDSTYPIQNALDGGTNSYGHTYYVRPDSTNAMLLLTNAVAGSRLSISAWTNTPNIGITANLDYVHAGPFEGALDHPLYAVWNNVQYITNKYQGGYLDLVYMDNSGSGTHGGWQVRGGSGTWSHEAGIFGNPWTYYADGSSFAEHGLNSTQFSTDTAHSTYGVKSEALITNAVLNAGFYLGTSNTGIRETYGTGSPESVVTAPVSSVFHRSDGGAGTVIYVKESGAGNTGWVAYGAGGGGSVPVGTVVSTGTPIINSIPIYNPADGTNVIPSKVTISALTNLLTGALVVTNDALFQNVTPSKIAVFDANGRITNGTVSSSFNGSVTLDAVLADAASSSIQNGAFTNQWLYTDPGAGNYSMSLKGTNSTASFLFGLSGQVTATGGTLFRIRETTASTAVGFLADFDTISGSSSRSFRVGSGGTTIVHAGNSSAQLLASSMVTATTPTYSAISKATGGTGYDSGGSRWLFQYDDTHYLAAEAGRLATTADLSMNRAGTVAGDLGLFLTNSTAAISGTQQQSPWINLMGNAYNTTGATSGPAGFKFGVIPTQAAIGTSSLVWSNLANGTWSNPMSLSSAGVLTIGTSLNAPNGNVTVGGSVSSAFGFIVPSKSYLQSPSDGVWVMSNNAGTTGATLNLGSINATNSIIVGGGTAITKILTATATLDFGSIAAGASADLTITVTGTATGDSVSMGLPAAPDGGISFDAFVSSANTITIRAHNVNLVSSVDPASASYRATVIHY